MNLRDLEARADEDIDDRQIAVAPKLVDERAEIRKGEVGHLSPSPEQPVVEVPSSTEADDAPR